MFNFILCFQLLYTMIELTETNGYTITIIYNNSKHVVQSIIQL